MDLNKVLSFISIAHFTHLAPIQNPSKISSVSHIYEEKFRK